MHYLIYHKIENLPFLLSKIIIILFLYIIKKIEIFSIIFLFLYN